MALTSGNRSPVTTLVLLVAVAAAIAVAAWAIWDYNRPPIWNEAFAERARKPLPRTGFPYGSPPATRASTRPARPTRPVDPTEISQPFLVISGHNEGIHSIQYSPDGKLILSSSLDATVRLWDAETGRQVRALQGHTAPVWSARFSQDGARIVSGGDDLSVKVWNTHTGEQLAQCDDHRRRLVDAGFLPDARHVISGSHGDRLYLWNTDDEKIEAQFPVGGLDQHSVTVSPDGSLVAMGGCMGGMLSIWDVSTHKLLHQTKIGEKQITGLAFTPDSTRIVACSEFSPAHLYAARQGTRIRTYLASEGEHGIRVVAVSRDGKLVALASLPEVFIVDLESDRKLGTVRYRMDLVHAVDFSPGGDRLVLAGGGMASGDGFKPAADSSIYIYDLSPILGPR